MKHPFRSYLYQGPDFSNFGKPSQKRVRNAEYFEGWYFKHAGTDGHVVAFIPGISLGDDPHSFIQVNDSRAGSDYCRFPIEEARFAKNELALEIAGNRFSHSGIQIGLSSVLGEYRGSLNYHNVAALKPHIYRPGIMGPFSYIPGMECYHGLVSMDHDIEGDLSLEGKPIGLGNGRGYIEKDWGSSFPRAWIWMQANSFSDGASIMLSHAHIPWGRSSFPGHLGFLYHPEILPDALVFGSYSRYKLRKTEIRRAGKTLEVSAIIAGASYRLEISASSDEGRDLIAPRKGAMDRVIKETVAGRISCRLFMRGSLVWEGSSSAAGIEVQGPVEDLLL